MKDNLFGVQFLREAIDFFDSRPEFENEGKSPILLLEEFLEISDYGECQKCTYAGKLDFKEGFSGKGYYCDECGKFLS